MPVHRVRPMVWAGAAAVALIVGACTIGQRSVPSPASPTSGPSLDPHMTASPRPSPSPSPSPSPPRSPSAPTSPSPSTGWTEACGETIVRSHLVDVAANGRRLVGPARFWSDAVGASVAGVWVSDVGRLWRLIVLPYSSGTRGNEQPSSVAGGSAGFVIGGSIGQSEGGIAWWSADGEGWERFAVGDGGVLGATSGGGVYVLAGDTGMGGRPAIWWSENGRDWRAASIADGDQFGAIAGVIAGGPGFIAVGTAAAERGPDILEPGVSYPHLRWASVPWTSQDGRTWLRLESPAPFEWATVRSITRAGTILYAFGRIQQPGSAPVATAWRSDDGLAWRRLATEPPGDGASATYRGLLDGRVLAIVGTPGGPDRFGPAVTWISVDGSAWSMTAQPSIATAGIRSVATDGDGLVAVGSHAGGGDPAWRSEGCASVPIWYRTIPSLDGR